MSCYRPPQQNQKLKMMEQYFKRQEEYEEKFGNEKVVVLFQCGSFYESYCEKKCRCETPQPNKNNQCTNCKYVIKDPRGKAHIIDKILNVAIADKKRWLMTGFPATNPGSFQRYMSQLLKYGYKVIVYKQHDAVDDGRLKTNKEKVRILDKIYSNGTCNSNNDEITLKEDPLLLCIFIRYTEPDNYFSHVESYELGLSIYNIDMSTIYTGSSSTTHNDITIPFSRLKSLFCEKKFTECFVVTEGISNQDAIVKLKNYITLPDCVSYHKVTPNCKKIKYRESLFTRIFQNIDDSFTSQKLGLEQDEVAAISLAELIEYINEHEINVNIAQNLMPPISLLKPDKLIIHTTSLIQLNILSNYNHNLSVFSIVNNCVTDSGKNLLRTRLCNPHIDPVKIQFRLDLTESLLNDYKNFQKYLIKLNGLNKITASFRVKRLKYNQVPLFIKILNNWNKLYNGPILNLCDSKLPKHLHVAQKQFKKFVNSKFNNNDFKLLLEISEKMNSYFDVEKIKLFNNSDIRYSSCFKTNVFEHIDTLINKRNAILKYMNDIAISLRQSMPPVKTTRRKKPFIIEDSDVQVATHFKHSKCIYSYIISNTVSHFLKKGTKLKGSFPVEAPPIVIKIMEDYYQNVIFPNNTKPSWTNVLKEDTFSKKKYVKFEWHEPISNYLIELHTLIMKTVKTQFIQIQNELYNKYSNVLIKLSSFISELDVAVSSACCAKLNKFIKPIIVESDNPFLSIKQLRHPIIEQLSSVKYKANDIEIGIKYDGYIVHGVNAAGKSSLMKSVGIAVILAQSGLYVPAESMEFHPYTQLFTRITKDDDIFNGLSSFQTEMVELGNIIRRSDSKSLIIGDELCSGTETTSAISIVGASILNLLNKHSQFIFATHLHELYSIPELANNKRIRWVHMRVKIDSTTGVLTYSRELLDGQGPDSYGIEATAGFGFPKSFIESAKKIRKNKFSGQSIKASKYNASMLYGGMCAMPNCGNSVNDIHHLLYQRFSDKNNILDDGRHKNHVSNLAGICKACHKKIHEKNLIYEWVQTSEGRKLLLIESDSEPEVKEIVV